MEKKQITVEVSARHVHLSREVVEQLFGTGYELQPEKWLSQPGQFLAKERVNIIGEKGRLEKVAILGPIRDKTQVELALSDCFKLGVEGVVRNSGELDGTPGVRLETEKGEVVLAEGVIVPRRHIHILPQDAADLGVYDSELVSVKVENEIGRGIIFSGVLVRVSEQSSMVMHIDTDEGNAAMIFKTGTGWIV